MKRFFLSITLLVFSLLFLFSCGRGGDADPVVARFKGIDILASDVRIHMKYSSESVMMDYFMQYGTDAMMNELMMFGTFETDFNKLHSSGVTYYQIIREESVRTAVFFLAFMEMAAEFGITLSDEERAWIEEELDAEMEWFGEAAFYENLREQGFRDREHLALIYSGHVVLDNLVRLLLTDDELFAPFAHLMPPEQVLPELFGAMHILAFMDDFDTQEDAFAYISAIYERIQEGEDFFTLMHEYSHDPGLRDFPFGYTFTFNEMHTPFETAALALEYGEISPIVETPVGYHIIMRVEAYPDDWFMLHGEQPLTLHDRMMEAIFVAIQLRADESYIEYLPALNDV
jgi:hypothetical protein